MHAHTHAQTQVSIRVKIKKLPAASSQQNHEQKFIRDKEKQELKAVLFCFPRSKIQRVLSFNYKCWRTFESSLKDSQQSVMVHFLPLMMQRCQFHAQFRRIGSCVSMTCRTTRS